MSLELELEQFILSKYRSLREFTITNNLPYSTLVTALQRGILKTNWKTILSICNALEISADDLADGKIVERNESMSWQDKKLINSYAGFIEDHALLTAYHAADPGTQAAVRKLLDIAPPSSEESKKAT